MDTVTIWDFFVILCKPNVRLQYLECQWIKSTRNFLSRIEGYMKLNDERVQEKYRVNDIYNGIFNHIR